MGNGGSSGMAGQLCDRLGSYSKIYTEKSRHLNVSRNAFVPRNRSRVSLPRSSRLVRNSDSAAPGHSLCDCVQQSALDSFSLPDKEALCFTGGFSNNEGGVGG